MNVQVEKSVTVVLPPPQRPRTALSLPDAKIEPSPFSKLGYCPPGCNFLLEIETVVTPQPSRVPTIGPAGSGGLKTYRSSLSFAPLAEDIPNAWQGEARNMIGSQIERDQDGALARILVNVDLAHKAARLGKAQTTVWVRMVDEGNRPVLPYPDEKTKAIRWAPMSTTEESVLASNQKVWVTSFGKD